MSLIARAWRTISAVVGALMGLVPHLLHHAGLIFGAALVTGAAGNVLFGALGLLFSIPLLQRLYTKFDTWKAPALAFTVLVAMFLPVSIRHRSRHLRRLRWRGTATGRGA